MNNAAWRWRANCTRPPSGMKVSSERVIATRYLPVFSSAARSVWAKASTTSFSLVPLLGARLPVSMPPWPGSSTISGRGSLSVAGAGQL